jgi:hypothetical protein
MNGRKHGTRFALGRRRAIYAKGDIGKRHFNGAGYS